MSTNRIQCQSVLTDNERDALDRCAARNLQGKSLSAMAQFLRDKFGSELVLDQDIIAGFVRDSSNLPGRADALFRPQSERELAAIFRLCLGMGIPFTVSGGRSSLTGSATPESGIVISTVNMISPPLTVDQERQTVRSPVGIILEDMRRTVLEQSDGKLCYPVDPTSRADACVGGAIACNASGFTPGDAGTVRHWMESVDFILPNGMKITAKRGEYVSERGLFTLVDRGHTCEAPGAKARDIFAKPSEAKNAILTIRSHFAAKDGPPRGKSRGFLAKEGEIPVPRYPRKKLKNASGPYSSPEGSIDFVDLVVGSEGIFGAVTACEMRLAPSPAGCLDLFFSLPSEENALAFLDYLRTNLAGGLGQLTALEYFGVNCRKYMAHENLLFRGSNQVGIYIQQPLAGITSDDAAGVWLERLVAADSGIDENAVIMLDNEHDRKVFMEARHSMPANALEVVQHRGTYTIMTDTVVPPEHFREFLEFTHAAIRSEALDYLAFGHFGDCHLHFTILPEQEKLVKATAIYDLIVAESAQLGGVYSGEHGTGKRKRRDFLRCHGQAASEQVRRCKAALDPEFLLNRGNVINQ